MTDGELLRQYARGGADAHEAFAALVRLHADWVYAVARRRVGNRELAEDVAQAAFIVLAQKGKQLPPTTPLAPWLFRVTCFAAGRARRDESRRRRHEARVAAERNRMTTAFDPDGDADRWDDLAPVLDRAVESLSSGDRHAVLLRFYQRRSLADVGRMLGISEDAARKRVSRAVERLRQRLAVLGVRAAHVAPAVLTTLLLELAADAQAGMAAAHASRWAAVSVAADGASAASVTSTELAKGAIRMILWNNTKAAVAAVLAMAVVLGGVVAGVHAVVAQRSPPPTRTVNDDDGSAPTPPQPAVETIETQNVLFAISPDKKHLAAFAMATGRWEPLPDARRDGAAPDIRQTMVLAQDVGTYVDDKSAYGFSGITGKWDSVAINNPPPATGGGGCMVAQHVAAYVDGQRVHGYGAPAGKWDTLTLPAEGGPPTATVTQDTVRVYHAKTFHLFSAKTGKWTQPPFQERE